MFFIHENRNLEIFADLLEKGTSALFAERGELNFSSFTKEKKKIIDSEGRMRADGMEKFSHEPTYVSAVNYFTNATDMSRDKALGALIVYVEQAYLPQLMKLLKYPPVDDESEDAMLDCCGTLSNIIAGRFKSEISQAGYIELEMSHFVNYRNSAFNGVNFPSSEYHLFELSGFLDGKKRLVMEMTMGAVPRH